MSLRLGHRRFRDQLSDYADGQLSPRLATRFERHLASCADCRKELGELRRMLELLHDLPAAEPGPGSVDALLRRMAETEARPRRWLSAWGAPVAAAAAGLAALLLVQDVSVSIGLPGSAVRPEARSASLVAAEARALPRRPAPPAPSTAAMLGRRAEFAPATPGAPSGASSSGRSALAACIGSRDTRDCIRYHWMLDLAGRDVPAFLEVFESLPEAARPRLAGDLADLARGSGSATAIADHLRASRDPRAATLAARFAAVGRR